MFSHHSLCKLLCFCGAALCTLPPGVLFVCPQRAYKHPGKGRQKKNREREETVSVKLMFSPLLSSPLCWNPSSFHLAAALVMNYALGSCEIRQESTPTLLRCVCLYVCAGGVNYQTYIWSGRLWGREMPEHDFPSFFCLPLTLSLPPFSPSLHSSVISVTPRRPRFSIDSNSVLSALLWIPSFHLALWMAEKNRGENWPFLSLLSLSLHVSVFVCVRLFVRVCGGGCGVDIG